MSKTVTMIHGAFAASWCFANFVDVFEKRGWTCHTPDLRFHGVGAAGEPDPRLAETSIGDYTDDLARHLASFDEAPVLIGHSMGGLIAQQLAAKGLARALILLASVAPRGILPSTEDEFAVATGLMAAGAFWTMSLKPVFEVAEANSLDKIDAASKRAVFDKCCPESGRALFESFFWMFDDRNATAVDTAKVTCPVLVMFGAEDKVVSANTARQIAQLYAGHVTSHEAAGHGHFLMLEPGWERLAERCADWASHGCSADA